MDLDFSQFNPATVLEAILEYDQEKIIGRTPARLAPYLHLEALAQCCGLHLRYIHNFQIQAFLVSMTDLGYDLTQIQTGWTIKACLTAQTPTAARYALRVHNGTNCVITMGYKQLKIMDNFFKDRFLWLSTRSSKI